MQQNWIESKYASDAAAPVRTVRATQTPAGLSKPWSSHQASCLWFKDKHTHRCEILSRLGECMNYSLNRETLVCLMALVMVTKGDWQPARTHKQKHDDLGQDGASSAGYITLPPWSRSDMLFCKAYVNCVPGRQALALKCDFNQRRCLDPCEYCKSPGWASENHIKYISHENTGLPRASWQAARVCCCPCLCADTPEFPWPSTEPSQLQRGHRSTTLTGRAPRAEPHPIPPRFGLKENQQYVLNVHGKHKIWGEKKLYRCFLTVVYTSSLSLNFSKMQAGHQRHSEISPLWCHEGYGCLTV